MDALPIPYMAINITIYNFAKKINSTARPSSGGQLFSCELIENTSIISPMIRLNLSAGDFSPVNKNYAYISNFNRYYFITDWTYELGTWVASLAIDVLATARTEIGVSTQYIRRSSHSFDGNIVDTAYPTKTNYSVTKCLAERGETYGVPRTIFGEKPTPCFIVGVIGGVDANVFPVVPESQDARTIFNGSVVYYVLRPAQMRQLYEMLMDDIDAYHVDPSEISKALQKQLINPLQYIHSVKMLPCTPTNVVSHQIAGVDFGFDTWYIPFQRELGQWAILANEDIGGYSPIPNQDVGYMTCRRAVVRVRLHPDYENRGHYVIGSPYSKYVLRLEPFGQIELPSGNILACELDQDTDPDDPHWYIQLFCDATLDFSTGDCRLKVWARGGAGDVIFYEGTQNVGIEVPVHQSTQDAMGFQQAMRSMKYNAISAPFDALHSMLGGMSTQQGEEDAGGGRQGDNVHSLSTSRSAVGTIAGAIEKGKSLVDSATRANQVSISGGGSAGSYIGFKADLCSPVVDCYFASMVDELRSDIGRPLMSPRQISAIPGYILCQNGHIETGLTSSENQAIESFLNGGFYYE